MKKCLIFFILFVNLNAHSSPSQEIINHFKDINSLEFKFSQKIDNNKIETMFTILIIGLIAGPAVSL